MNKEDFKRTEIGLIPKDWKVVKEGVTGKGTKYRLSVTKGTKGDNGDTNMRVKKQQSNKLKN